MILIWHIVNTKYLYFPMWRFHLQKVSQYQCVVRKAAKLLAGFGPNDWTTFSNKPEQMELVLHIQQQLL